MSWASDNLRTFPWRETTDPYVVLIAEILLQKTAAEKVEPVYEDFRTAYPTLEELAEADRDELADIIYSLGFQNQRSKALISIGRTLRNGGVPDDTERLVLLAVLTLNTPWDGHTCLREALCSDSTLDSIPDSPGCTRRHPEIPTGARRAWRSYRVALPILNATNQR